MPTFQQTAGVATEAPTFSSCSRLPSWIAFAKVVWASKSSTVVGTEKQIALINEFYRTYRFKIVASGYHSNESFSLDSAS